MPDTTNAKSLLEKNSEVRNEMLRRKGIFSHDSFYFNEIKEYQNEFSGDGNKLDNIAGLRFTNLMSLNAYLNKGRFLSDKYITPGITEFYGSNPQVSGNIGYFNIYTARNGAYDMEDGRIVDDYGSDAKFIKVERNPLSDKEFYFLKRNLDKAKKYGFTPNGDTEYGEDFVKEFNEKIEESDAIENIYHENPNVDSIERTSIDYSKENISKILEGLKKGYAINDNWTMGRKTLFSVTDSLFKNNVIRKLENTQSKNLPKKGSNSEFCRNWNKYKEYSTLKDIMGNYKNPESGEILPISDIQKNYYSFRANGDTEYLGNNTVLRDSGYVNIVRREELKKCMFSIENLAWKDVPKKQKKYLSDEQTGPNGGRIMWFPPYDISFNESVNVNWDSRAFIGRGEKVYTYTDTERTGTLSFTLLIDHPNIVNPIKKDEIKEEDILRFFNGEQLLEAKAKIENDKEDNTNPTQHIPEVPETQPKEEKKIKFTIYFPFNYSGMYGYQEDNLNESLYKQNINQCIDTDWWTYLLIGRNTEITKWSMQDGADLSVGVYPTEWRGYEINDGGISFSGITESAETYSVKEYVPLKAWKLPSDYEFDESRKYHYRVDYDMRAYQEDTNNYFDISDASMLNNYVVPSGATNEFDSNGIDYSAAEGIMGVVNYSNGDNNKFSGLTEYLVGNSASADRINEIADDFRNFEISKIELTPHVSSIEGGGDKNNQKVIGTRRAWCVGNFLANRLKKTPDIKETIIAEINSTDINLEEQKRARCVDVVVSFKTTDEINVANTANGATVGENGEINISDNVGSIATNVESNNDSESPEKRESNIDTTEVKRYETEADYFERIETTTENVDKMIRDEIHNKIKYFNPAFHSISPEGFNARLTFLQQCTRQGHTIEQNDENAKGKAAGNLAFGRMPVCVLTLGDFICSRVIIGSMSIDYSDDGILWDLNKTGAGVQPMFAKVSMQLTLLGGQSLNGPISKLQNAVSFNYYANTGVYDDRADRISLDKDGNETYESIWAPYPNDSMPKKQ